MYKFREVIVFFDWIIVFCGGEVVVYFEIVKVDEVRFVMVMVGVKLLEFEWEKELCVVVCGFLVFWDVKLGFGEIFGIVGVDGNG